jgi:hypothetical protein
MEQVELGQLFCKFPGCKNLRKQRLLYCSGHRRQIEHGSDLTVLRQWAKEERLCIKRGCKNRSKAHGLCQHHYDKIRPNRNNKEASRKRSLMWSHGLTVDGYDALLKAQNHSCAVCKERCKSGRRLAVDHNHRSGEIRGLLCARCNTALGLMEENPERITRLLDYAAKWHH